MIDWESADAIRIKAAYWHALRDLTHLDLMECHAIEDQAQANFERACREDRTIDVPPHGGLPKNVPTATVAGPSEGDQMTEQTPRPSDWGGTPEQADRRDEKLRRDALRDLAYDAETGS